MAEQMKVLTEKDLQQVTAKQRVVKVISQFFLYLFLIGMAIIVIFPFYWMILSSLKSYTDYNAESVPQFITLSPTLENYMIAFTSVPLLDYFLNTLIFTVATTALMMAVIIPAAFAFARLNFKGKNILFVLFLSLMMIPDELVIITN